jgi:hypothetical protein
VTTTSARLVAGPSGLPPGFAHPHASEEARRIAETGLILRVQVSSGVHGTSVAGQDDRDEMGVCLEPPEFVTGLARVPSGITGDEPSPVPEPDRAYLGRFGAAGWCWPRCSTRSLPPRPLWRR